MPARLRGKKATGGAIELLLTRCLEDMRAPPGGERTDGLGGAGA